MDFKKILISRRNQLIIIVLVTLITYINILPNGFAWDDRDFFLDWPQIKSTEGLPAYLSLPYLLAGDLPLGHRGIYRPLRSIYYLASYSIWGENPLGYHIQAIIVHTLIVLVIYLITELITKKKYLAFIVAILFATHPIHTEAITYTAASMDTLGILFFFLSFYFYLKIADAKHKKRMYLLGSLIYALMAFFTYEITLVLPLLIILYDFCMNQFSFRSLFSKINIYKNYFLIFVVYFLIRFLILGIGNRADYLGVGWQVAANQIRVVIPEVVANYLWWFIWPVKLNISHNFSVNILNSFIKSLNAIDKTGNLVNLSTHIVFLFPLVYALISFFLIYWVFKKYPLIVFSLSWIIITLLPVSDIIPQGASIAERFLYIPSYGFILLSGFLIYNSYQFLKKEKHQLYRYLSYVIIPFFILTTLFYIFTAIKRNRDWKNEETIWLSAINTDPTHPIPYIALGKIYSRIGQYDNGLSMYKKAIDLSQPDPQLNSELGLIYEKKGEIEKDIKEQQRALEINSQYYLAHVRLGNVYLKQRKFQLAENEYRSALEIKKNDPSILSLLGDVYFNQGKYDQAIEVFNESLKLDPEQPKIYLKLAYTYKEKGETQKSIKILEEGLKITNDPVIKTELERISKNN